MSIKKVHLSLLEFSLKDGMQADLKSESFLVLFFLSIDIMIVNAFPRI
jgi:hypothetical protein